MIEISTLEVAGLSPAIHAMRNPLSSWLKSDSPREFGAKPGEFEVGDADKDLSIRLQKAGPEHCKHLRMVTVHADITAPLYWWKQMDCYRAGVEKLSTSTMHTLLKRPFRMEDFSFETLPGYKHEPDQFVPEVDEKNEIWADYDGYKVSNQGRIIGVSGKVLQGVLHRDGYRFVWCHDRIIPLHRIVATCFCEGYEKGKVVDHIDGNKQNNKASNLEWVTQKENIRRSRENNLQPNPSKAYEGKLTEEERNAVIDLCKSGKYSRREVANMFGVTHTTVCSIINGKYEYKGGSPNVYELVARPLVDELNRLRDDYMSTDDQEEKKKIWQAVVSLLPESFNQKRTVMFSYAAIRNIVKQRAGHKLPEWESFIAWVNTLPESWMITE